MGVISMPNHQQTSDNILTTQAKQVGQDFKQSNQKQLKLTEFTLVFHTSEMAGGGQTPRGGSDPLLEPEELQIREKAPSIVDLDEPVYIRPETDIGVKR